MRIFAVALLLLASARAIAQQGTPRATIQLRVVASASSLPVPYADVAIASEKYAAFTDSAGRLTIRYLPAGPVSIRVRRIGFQSVVTTIMARANVETPLVVSLPIVALRLADVKVSGDVCPGGGTADTAVVAILQQARLNAERYALLAERYPFVVTMERIWGEQGRVPIHWVGRSPARRGDRVDQAHDTVEVTGRSEWRYAPGKLIVPGRGRIAGAADVTEKMIVPHLVDFSDEAFVASHCFKYAGLSEADSGRRVIRVDFRPTRSVKTPDVRGSLYFDPQTYQIRKSTLHADRPAPSAAATDTWRVRVDAWFSEVFHGIPVLHRIESTTSVETLRRGAPNPFVATEDHRMLDLRFLRGRPGEGSFTGDEGRSDAANTGMSLACPDASGGSAPIDSAALEIDGAMAKVCYSRMSSGDTPATLLLGRELEVGGVVLRPGRYIMRAFFGPEQNVVRFFADSAGGTTEVGRGTAFMERLDTPSGGFTVRADAAAGEPAFVLEWTVLRARLPLWSRR